MPGLSGLWSRYAAGFAEYLDRLGYKVMTRRQRMTLVAHMSRWLARDRLDATGADGGRGSPLCRSTGGGRLQRVSFAPVAGSLTGLPARRGRCPRRAVHRGVRCRFGREAVVPGASVGGTWVEVQRRASIWCQVLTDRESRSRHDSSTRAGDWGGRRLWEGGLRLVVTLGCGGGPARRRASDRRSGDSTRKDGWILTSIGCAILKTSHRLRSAECCARSFLTSSSGSASSFQQESSTASTGR